MADGPTGPHGPERGGAFQAFLAGSAVGPTGASPTAGPVTKVTHVPRELTMYNVTEEELGLLRAVGPTLSIAFFGIAIGALATFIGTLQTQTLGNRANAVFIGFAAAAAAIALITGIQAIVGYGRLHRITKKIRERPAE